MAVPPDQHPAGADDLRRVGMNGTLLIERRPGHAWVEQRGELYRTDVEQFLSTIDEALAAWNVDRMVVDNRHIEQAEPEVVQRIWTWLSTHPRLVRIAVIVNGREVASRIDFKSVTESVQIRAFHREEPAVRWVTILS